MSEQLGRVEIGAREIYDAVQAVRADVRDLRSDAQGRAADVSDHESRLRSLERARWPLPSLAALVSVIALLVAAVDLMR